MKSNDIALPIHDHEVGADDDGPSVGFTELLTWLGEAKRLIALVLSLPAEQFTHAGQERRLVRQYLQGKIPEEILVDLSGLDIGQTVHIGDLALPKGVKATQAADVVVATVTGSSAQASEDAAAEASEG